MKQSKIFILALFLICSCIKNKSENSIQLHFSEIDQEKLAQDCRAIAKQGNILTLLSEIKSDTRTIFQLLESSNPNDFKDRIILLADGISEKSKKVIRLAPPEWTVEQWDYEINWEITRDDLIGFLGTPFKKRSKIIDYQLDSVFFMGEERNDLKDKVFLVQDKESLKISYKNLASSLDFCQLKESLTLLLKVRFKNLKKINSRFFNLTVDNDHTESL